jgi:hypothetical protein
MRDGYGKKAEGRENVFNPGGMLFLPRNEGIVPNELQNKN